jgi:aminoglycoside phosphotransferase (APT) family kinase protein
LTGLRPYIAVAVHQWSPDVDVDRELVGALIAAQFPELAGAGLEPIGEGWDNSVWLVDGRWAFRFPRRAIARAGIEREIAVLPRLAPLLALPIPVPVFVGRPADGYPFPFFGCELIPGEEAALAGLDDDARRRLAGELGAFLRALHAGEVAERVDPHGELPVDPNGRANMSRRVTMTREWLAEGERLGLWSPPRRIEEWFEAACELPPATGSALAHGDLHGRHLLVDGRGAAAGVIDWGDVCRADPAIDLSLYWSLLPVDARRGFLDAYGPVTPEQLLRARVLALCLCAALGLYGHHERMPALERDAVAGLARSCRD